MTIAQSIRRAALRRDSLDNIEFGIMVAFMTEAEANNKHRADPKHRMWFLLIVAEVLS